MAGTINRSDMMRMVRMYRRERRRPYEYARFIPQLMKEFLADDAIFTERFGVDPVEFEEILELFDGKIRRTHTRFRNNIGSRERLAVCLRFLASGESMQDLSRQYNLPYTVIPVVVREMCKTISKFLKPIVLPEPNKEMWLNIASDFKRKFSMPNCIGAIEGKNLYANGHKIVFLAIVDARDRFIVVDVGPYRLNAYRGNVMDKSIMGKRFLKKGYDVPENTPLTENSEPLPYMILGSSFFPPKPYLMTKYSRPECASNDTNRIFNTRLSRAKVTVNRALMGLRDKWRVFQGPLPVPPNVVESLVLTCCCLHNFFGHRSRTTLLENRPDSIVAITQERLESLQSQLPAESVDVRDQFKKYFLSPEGQVPWQWQDVLR